MCNMLNVGSIIAPVYHLGRVDQFKIPCHLGCSVQELPVILSVPIDITGGKTNLL